MKRYVPAYLIFIGCLAIIMIIYRWSGYPEIGWHTIIYPIKSADLAKILVAIAIITGLVLLYTKRR